MLVDPGGEEEEVEEEEEEAEAAGGTAVSVVSKRRAMLRSILLVGVEVLLVEFWAAAGTVEGVAAPPVS